MSSNQDKPSSNLNRLQEVFSLFICSLSISSVTNIYYSIGKWTKKCTLNFDEMESLCHAIDNPSVWTQNRFIWLSRYIANFATYMEADGKEDHVITKAVLGKKTDNLTIC